ncbi:TldD/PmbA family protein [bacterium]|nr:TldD/PmbA family protein [bacterium]
MAEVLEKQFTTKKLMQRQDELVTLARHTLQCSDADQTQVNIITSDSALTRFANSEIHQNTYEREANLVVTVRLGQREGRISTNVLTREGAADTVARAIAAARISQPNPDLADLPTGPYDYPFRVDYHEATAACTPEERADLVIKGFEAGEDKDFNASGILRTGQLNCVVANNQGVEAAVHSTKARYQVVWGSHNSSGKSEVEVRNIKDIDIEEHSTKAYAIAKKSQNPRNDIDAGRYTVVLGPNCISTMLGFIARLGFSGRRYNDGASFMCGRMGQPITGNQITITDDPLDERTLGLPFDNAGVPRQRITLVESGVARAVVHDANTAKRAGTVSTGHDNGMRYPVPSNLVMNPGISETADLIAGVERGIFVSNFHYTNVVDPMAAVITGMTRDGTFLIEDGKLTSGLTNFRFTQNVLEAFANVTGMGSELLYMPAFWGAGALVPESMRVDNFNFSGKTDF